MVDEFGPAAADGAVDGPVLVQREQVVELGLGAALRFPPVDSLAGVLDYFVARRDARGGINPPAVNL